MKSDLQIRVFVSSTFRDMQAERDHLIKFIFPQLRSLCEARGVTWGEVDLRWGITDEEKAEGKVLPLCLNEIQRCRPYFIGMLGERYGWVPQEIADDLIKEYPWVGQQIGRSVTELEIVQGVLRNREMHGHAFFYFRDPFYLEKIAPQNRADFAAEDDEHAANLKRLKGEIRRAQTDGICQLREPYRDPEELGKWILEDFTKLIEQLFPDNQLPSLLDRQKAEHAAFGVSRERLYIGRPEYFEQLDAYAAKGGPPLTILGDSGSGKSSLLANWAARYRSAHPADFLLTHFIGSTAQSSDWAAMLRRILGELNRSFDMKREIPEHPDALRAAFAKVLAAAAARGKIVLVLDALNQLEDGDGALDLTWLPSTIPANARIVFSTLPGRPLEEINRRGGWPVFQVERLNDAERRRFVVEYLGQYSKGLDTPRIERIAATPSTANPLYLRTLLEEMRIFGSHEQLDERLAYYLEAGSVVDLYQRILARWEADYDGGIELVRNAMSLLWSSRRGLSESELLDLLGANELPLPRAIWSPFYLAADQTLVNHSGLLTYFHEYLRQAVEERYLPGQEERRAVHQRVADYFAVPREIVRLQVETFQNEKYIQQLAPQYSVRQTGEVLWQLAAAGSYRRLSQFLCDGIFLYGAWNIDKLDVKHYWAELERNGLQMTDGYRRMLDDPEHTDLVVVDVVTQLLESAGHRDEAQALLKWKMDNAGQKNPLNLPNVLIDQGLSFRRQENFEGAMTSFKEAERLCREFMKNGVPTTDLATRVVTIERQPLLDDFFENGIATCLVNQATILHARDDFAGASVLLKEAEKIAGKKKEKNILASCYYTQALVARESGDLVRAATLFRKAQQFYRELNNREEMERCTRQLNSLPGTTKREPTPAPARAERTDPIGFLDKIKGIFRSGPKRDPQAEAVALGERVMALRAAGDFSKAGAMLDDVVKLFREARNTTGLGNCARLYAEMAWGSEAKDGQTALSVAFAQRGEKLAREVDCLEGLIEGLRYQVYCLLVNEKKPAAALPLAEEAYRLAQQSGSDLTGMLAEMLNFARHGTGQL